MRILRNLLLLLAIVSPGLASAQAQPVVVELYTSQGCSSCPTADEYLAEIATRSDVIALSLHVDYWDYMGWKDVFASPKHSKRQRKYAKVNRQRTVFTPAMVIQGQDIVVGSRKKQVEPTLRAHAGKSGPAQITLAREGNTMRISIKPNRKASASVVQLVRFAPKHTVSIKRGENRGRTIEYTNVVEAWDEIGKWSGSGAKSYSVKVASGGNFAVILQERNNGPILAAAQLN